MTAPDGREPQQLDVAVAPVGRGGRGAGGQRAVAIVGIALAGVVGLAALGGATAGPAPSVRPSAVPSTDVASSPAVAVVPSRAPATPIRPPERLPTLTNQPLPGAPTVVFYARRSSDLARLEWSPGGAPALAEREPVAEALGGINPTEPYAAIASPDGSRVAIRGLVGFGSSTTDVVRVVRSTGELEWSGAGAGLPIAPLWSPDGRRVLLPGVGERWRVVTVGGEPSAELSLDPSAFALGPRELAQPLAFSADGEWLYAAVIGQRRLDFRPLGRFSMTDGTPTELERLPIDGPEAPAPLGRLGYVSDPLTGRRAIAPSAALSAGPTDVRVVEADGSEAFTVRLDVVVGLAWTGDGRLLALEMDLIPGPSRMRLIPIDAAGRIGEPLIEGGRLTWASLAGARDGYALLAFAAGRSPAGVLVVVLRLSDGATATLPISPGRAPELHFAAWR